MNPSRPSFICASCARALRNATKPQRLHQFSSEATKAARASMSDDRPTEQIPRWKQTPPAMTMPIRLRPHPKQPVWVVNTDEEKLNAAYDSFLGNIGGTQKGRDLLDEETKWLAITHKSFDHGRRGFNDRLAFLGKRILDLQCSQALLRAPIPPQLANLPAKDVFKHPALHGLENISSFAKLQVLDKRRLADIANTHGIDAVVRWKPRRSDNLYLSGVEAVLAHTVYSIIGALALRQGGEVAARAARERVLEPLGLR